MATLKLKNCRNCFHIVENETWVAAVGDRIVIYSRTNFSLHGVVPAGELRHPYALRFLSEHVFLAKNQLGQYLLYDVEKKEALWTFQVPGCSGLDNAYAVSVDGKRVFDVVLTRRGLSGLVIWPEEQRYEWEALPEPESGWREEAYVAVDGEDKLHLALVDGRKTILMERARLDTGDFHVQNTLNGVPCWLDEEYLVLEDGTWLDYRSRKTGTIAGLWQSSMLERKRYPQWNLDLMQEWKNGRLSFRSFPDGREVGTVFQVPGTEDRALCDAQLLDDNGSMLIGTMNGLYLYQPQ